MTKLFYDEVEIKTKEMVRIPSIVKSGTESDMAQYVYDELGKLNYFRNHPSQLVMQKTLKDEYDRHSTLALLKGNAASNKTIVLMGHTDTVEVDDYGELKNLAFDPDALEIAMSKLDLSEEVRKDLTSGEYLFGRGALDMKAGIAGHMALMKYFEKRREQLLGNLVLIAECDEEDGSHGIISALKILKQWKKEHNLDYILAINADYSTPYYPGDPNRYIYLGTIGKILPTFFIAGKETHVGQAFSGYDPNLLLAELTRKINLNTNLSDTAAGETTIPPVSLKQEDSKKVYTVQTALYAHGYYNFFTHGMTPKDVFEKLKSVAEEAVRDVEAHLENEYRTWCSKANFPYKPLNWKVPVYTWSEFMEYCYEQDSDFYQNLETFKNDLHNRKPSMDMRIFSREVVKEMYRRYYGHIGPCCILYNSSIYSQNIEIKGDSPEEAKIVDSLHRAVASVQRICQNPIKIKYFYPYISDSSFVYVPKDLSGLLALKENMPSWGEKYIHPIEDMQAVSMPVVNIGTYGKNGHTKYERVHKEFTFEMIPRISLEMIKNMLDITSLD